MRHVIETEEFDHGIVGEVSYDDYPINPRKDYEQVATMVCWHRRYNLGDEQPSCDPTEYFRGLLRQAGTATDCIHCDGSGEGDEDEDGYVPECPHCEGTGEMSDADVMEELEKTHYILPLYLYDHSGITISTGRFSCPWDSGQVGWIFVSHERAKAEWGEYEMEVVKPGSIGPSGYIPPEYKRGRKRTASDYYECMEAEVKVYDDYLTGEMYQYTVMNAEGDVLDSCCGYHGDLECVRREMRESAELHVKKAIKEAAEAEYWAERGVPTV